MKWVLGISMIFIMHCSNILTRIATPKVNIKQDLIIEQILDEFLLLEPSFDQNEDELILWDWTADCSYVIEIKFLNYDRQKFKKMKLVCKSQASLSEQNTFSSYAVQIGELIFNNDFIELYITVGGLSEHSIHRLKFDLETSCLIESKFQGNEVVCSW